MEANGNSTIASGISGRSISSSVIISNLVKRSPARAGAASVPPRDRAPTRTGESQPAVRRKIRLLGIVHVPSACRSRRIARAALERSLHHLTS